MRVRGGLGIALAAFAVTLACFVPSQSHATGRRIINNWPVTAASGSVRVPVAIADAQIIYPIIKRVGPGAAARALGMALGPAGAAAAVAAAMVLEYNSEHGSNITYNITNNNWTDTSRTYSWISTMCGPNPWVGSGPIAHYQECLQSVNVAGQYTNGMPLTCSVTATDTLGPRNYGCTWPIMKPNGSYSHTASGGFSRAANVFVSETPLTPTDQQLSDVVSEYGSPYNQRDFWEPYPGAGQDWWKNLETEGHEPLPMSQAQKDALRNQLATSCNPSGDALVYELCVMGKEFGVVAAPDAESVAEAVQPDGETATDNSVTVNIVPDTAGGTFTAPTLETLDTFAGITSAFMARIAAAPLPTAFAAITTTWPSGSCPTATVDLGTVGTHELMGWACPLWADHMAPILAVLMTAVWGFIGLRIIFTA